MSLSLLLFVLAGFSAADRSGWLLAKKVNDLAAYHGRNFKVISVISGDVIEVDAPDALNERAKTHVRLWGISAPQPPRPGREPEPMWDEAVEFISRLSLANEIVLKLESQRTRDPQGRLLAHAELPGGETLSESLLGAGLARRDEQWPHSMLTAYAQAENRARRRGVGLWSQ